MAHITLPHGVPGIISLLKYRPETGKPLSEFTQVLLRGESPLSPGERELIATYVSHRNECCFCTSSHAAAASLLLSEGETVVAQVKKDLEISLISEKLKALLKIAGKVQMGGKNVSKEDIEKARNCGASDQEIHDTVLIAAAFCMFNRYVDGLATWTPEDASIYQEIGQRLAKDGYNHT